jgi:hypothetical protein
MFFEIICWREVATNNLKTLDEFWTLSVEDYTYPVLLKPDKYLTVVLRFGISAVRKKLPVPMHPQKV